jgi:hypothetical protein
MEIKFNCSNPKCQRRIAVEEAMAGQAIACPVCAAELQVPASTNIKFNCTHPGCDQHVVVDVSEAGRFIRCPSCDKPLQIPGAPPKPIVDPQLTPVRRQPVIVEPEKIVQPKQKRQPEPEEEEPVLLSPVKRWLYGWGAGLAVLCFLTTAMGVRQKLVLPKHFDAIADEIFAAGEFRTGPIANDEHTRLLYTRNANAGGGVFLADPRSDQSTLLTVQKDGLSMDFADRNMFAWAPGGGLFALPDKVALPDESHPHLGHHLNIYDASTAAQQQAVDLPERAQEIAWLTTNSLVVLGRSGTFYLVKLENHPSISQIGEKGIPDLERAAMQKSDITCLTRVSDHLLAYLHAGNIWTFDLSSGQTQHETNLRGSQLRDLDYNPDSGEYLFGLNDQRHNDALYRVSPYGQNPNPVAVMQRNPVKGGADEIAITQVENAQWVLGGQGVAYMKADSLFVEAKDESLSTNLFADGYVAFFRVAPGQGKLYAVASVGTEPFGIWEYDLHTRELHSIIPGSDKPFAYAQSINLEDHRVDGPSGKSRIYYKCLPPVDLAKGKKYPALVRARFNNYPAPEAQFIANAGIFYVLLANGSTVTATNNLSNDARRMLTTYYGLLNNPNVDPDRIYLLGATHYTFDMSQLLNFNPSLWRGVFFEAPVVFPDIQTSAADCGSLSIVTGGDDLRSREVQTEKFIHQVYACALPFRLRSYPGAGNILTSTDLLKDRYKFIAKFILEDY